MQEVRLRALPSIHSTAKPYTEQTLLVELVETDTKLDGGFDGNPELIGNVIVRVGEKIEVEVIRIDEAWTGPVEVTVR